MAQINLERLALSSKYKGPNRFVTIVFWTAITFLYLPIFYLLLQAFLVDPNNFLSGFTLKWVTQLFMNGTLWEPLMNSLLIAFISATLSVTLGTLGAVGLNPVTQKIPLWLSTLIMLPIMLPEVITGLSLLLLFLIAKIPLGFGTVVIAHASFSASFVFFIMQEQLRKLDPQMAEAAEDLGAEAQTVFWKVIFPNIVPGLLGGWLLAFTLSFDDFLISFFTSGVGLTTLPLKIYSLMRIGLSPELNALCFFMIAMSTVLVLLLVSKESSRKWVVKG